MKLLGKLSTSVACLALAAVLAGPAVAGGDAILGVWSDTEKGSTLKVYNCDGGICVQIVKVKELDAKDVNNPDTAQRGRPVEGIVIMSGASKSGENSWKGKLYNREDGRSYSGSLTVLNNNEVKLEGCGLAGLICKSRVWRRAE